MELIGDPQTFAIQMSWDLEDQSHKPWMYGTFCVYICGEQLGIPTAEVYLSDILLDLISWQETIGTRSVASLMQADPLTAFFSIEEGHYGLEHFEHLLPDNFQPIPVPPQVHFEILPIDGLGEYKLYCIEDDDVSRVIYSRNCELPKEHRVPRALMTGVLLQTIARLEDWYSQVPEPPVS